MAGRSIVPSTDGSTHFYRCGDCHRLYVPTAGFSISPGMGREAVFWCTPPQTNKPERCTHDGALETWDGASWQPVVVPTAPVREVGGGFR